MQRLPRDVHIPLSRFITHRHFGGGVIEITRHFRLTFWRNPSDDHKVEILMHENTHSEGAESATLDNLELLCAELSEPRDTSRVLFSQNRIGCVCKYSMQNRGNTRYIK